MTHTPQGSVHDNLSGVGAAVHEKYSYCGDSIHLYTHCGTHVDTLNHLGHHGMFWNGWTADKVLGSRIWTKGGLDKYPPIIARGVLLDVAGMHGVDELDAAYGITPQDLQDTVAKQGVELRKKDVVLVRTGRMRAWPDFDGYLQRPPGITLPSAKWLCEEAGAMCIAGDSIGLEAQGLGTRSGPDPARAGPGPLTMPCDQTVSPTADPLTKASKRLRAPGSVPNSPMRESIARNGGHGFRPIAAAKLLHS